eukprot:COSAG02_NODE_1904_length_10439_cov_157.636267_1_plen_88_part_00
MADLEAGASNWLAFQILWSKKLRQRYNSAVSLAGMYGGNDTFGIANSPIDFEFNTLMLKGRKCEMSLKGGNAQSGELIVKYDGGRPT